MSRLHGLNLDYINKTLELPDKFGFVFNNYTAIDLALDSNVNFTSLIKRMIRNKDITTIINGKAIKDRKQVLQGVSFQYSTSLDRLKHASITIKQKKAINNSPNHWDKMSPGILSGKYDLGLLVYSSYRKELTNY